MLSVKYKSEWEIKLAFNKHDSMQISEEKLPRKNNGCHSMVDVKLR
jgi:hypothetical protein